MKHLMTGTALVAVLAIAAPAWAQTSEDLNRMELNQLSTGAPAPVNPAQPVAAPAPQPYAAAYPAPAYPAPAYPAPAYPAPAYAAPAYPYPYAYSYPYPYYGYPYYPVSLGWGWGGWRGGWGGWHGGWGHHR